MKINKVVLKLSDALLYGFLFFYFLYRAIFDSAINFQYSVFVLFISILLGVFAFLAQNHNAKSLIIYFAIGLLVLFVFQKFHFTDTRLLVLYLIGINIANYREEKIIRILLVFKIVFFLLIAFTVGFAQRNGIGSYVGNIVLLFMCLDKEKFPRKEFVFILFVILVLYFKNPENAGVLVILLTCFILQALRMTKLGKSFLCSNFMIYIFPICLLVTWYLSVSIGANKMPIWGRFLSDAVNNKYLSFVWDLNAILGTRLSLSKTAIDKIGIHAFGAEYFASGYNDLLMDAASRNAYFLVDSGYILLLIRWGLIATVLMCLISVVCMKYFVRQRAYNFIIAGVSLALWAVLEDNLFYAFILFFWIKALLISTRKMN